MEPPVHEPVPRPKPSSGEVQPRRVPGLLDIDLPRFDPAGTFNLQFNPRFRDLLKRGYIRVPTGVRWTADETTEFNVEVEAYFTHGLKHADTGNGLGEVRFGARRLLPRWPQPEFETSVGLNFEFPVGRPPVDMTDGLNHVTASVVTEHHYPSRRNWTEFAGITLDFVTASSVAGTLVPNMPDDDSISFTGGVVYQQFRLVWTLQGTYTTTLISGGNDHFFTLSPSVLWFAPRKYTWNSRTQWVLGLGFRSTWGPDGHDFSTRSRVRAEITFRQALDRLRSAFEKSR